jgi:hypothetical protein
MWIFCCGMIRSGSTVHYQLTKEIIEHKNLGKGLGWVEADKFNNLYKENKSNHTFKVVKIHKCLPQIEKMSLNGEALVIHIYRDLRDVIVSILNKDKTTFWKTFRKDFLDSLMNESVKWSGLEKVFVSKYEDMISDMATETKRIAEYLDIKLEESLVKKISQKFSIENQKKRIQDFNFEIQGIHTGINVHDPNSLLHQNHIFSGKKGQWQDSLSVIEIGLIEDCSYKWLKSNNYEISQPLFIRKIAKIQYFLYRFILKPKKIIKAIQRSPA